MIDPAEYLNFAQYMVNNLYKKYYVLNKRYEKEDLFQIACVTLVEAAKTFDRDKKGTAKFTSYAGNAIRYKLINYAKRDKKYNLKQNHPHNYLIYSLDYEVFDNDGKSIAFEEILNIDGDNNLVEESVISKIEADKLLSALDEDEYEIARMYFLNGMYQREIAKIMKKSNYFVSKKIKIIIDKLKNNAAERHDKTLN